MTDFTLDSRLGAESFSLGALSLCNVRLYDETRFPWLVLVPCKEDLVEIIDLTELEREALMDDITDASRALKEITNCHKLNVAALGNQVRQLHVHIIARFENDEAWPAPVWGKGTRVSYDDKARAEFAVKLKSALGLE